MALTTPLSLQLTLASPRGHHANWTFPFILASGSDERVQLVGWERAAIGWPVREGAARHLFVQSYQGDHWSSVFPSCQCWSLVAE